MAPRLARKANQAGPLAAPPTPADVRQKPAHITAHALPPEAQAMLHQIATMQAEALKQSTWVGERFADDARAMHYGDKDEAPIHGRATPNEARRLAEEGIAIAPLIVPFTPPDEIN